MFQSITIADNNSDDRRAFVDAAARFARVDEALIRSQDLVDLHRCVSARREAMAIASLEGEAVREESLVRLIGDADSTFIERGAKSAFDLYRAIGKAADLSLCPTANEIVEIFKVSEASKLRLMNPETLWTLEEDSHVVADLASRLIETPEPWLAVETIRQIWISGRFFGNSRRIAMILAPWCVSVGFSGSTGLLGIAGALSKSPCDLKVIATDPDVWAIEFANAIAQAAASQQELLGTISGLVATMHSLCPHERSSSSVSKAINFFIGQPISSARHFSQTLGLSPRGAKIVLDKMVDSGLLNIEGGSRNRSYVSRRSL